MTYITSKVIIVSRTKMNGKRICVGGYDYDKKQNIRLLTETAQYFDESAPFQIGQVYSIRYVSRYNNQIIPPHFEDKVVYEYSLIKFLTKQQLLQFIETLAGQPISINDLFNGYLNWENNSGYLLEDRIPSNSVCIARLNTDLISLKDNYSNIYFETKKSNPFNKLYKAKYVGIEELEGSLTIKAGTPIRFSLARWWDKNNDDKKRAYLQLSGFYL